MQYLSSHLTPPFLLSLHLPEIKKNLDAFFSWTFVAFDTKLNIHFIC